MFLLIMVWVSCIMIFWYPKEEIFQILFGVTTAMKVSSENKTIISFPVGNVR